MVNVAYEVGNNRTLSVLKKKVKILSFVVNYRDVTQNQNQYENITDGAACFPEGQDWECVPEGDYASCGLHCLNFD